MEAAVGLQMHAVGFGQTAQLGAVERLVRDQVQVDQHVDIGTEAVEFTRGRQRRLALRQGDQAAMVGGKVFDLINELADLGFADRAAAIDQLQADMDVADRRGRRGTIGDQPFPLGTAGDDLNAALGVDARPGLQRRRRGEGHLGDKVECRFQHRHDQGLAVGTVDGADDRLGIERRFLRVFRDQGSRLVGQVRQRRFHLFSLRDGRLLCQTRLGRLVQLRQRCIVIGLAVARGRDRLGIGGAEGSQRLARRVVIGQQARFQPLGAAVANLVVRCVQ